MFDVEATAGSVTINGLTLTRWPFFAGIAKGVLVRGLPKISVRNCVFWGLGFGDERRFRGIELNSSGNDVRIENNLFLGGLINGIYVRGINAVIRQNTFTLSPGILLDEGASATIDNNLFFRSADAVVCLPRNPPPNPSFACNDMWENSRNYFGCQDPTGTNGNIVADPLLCDPDAQDYRLLAESPCLPENSPPGCGLIGAFGPCQIVGVEPQVSPQRLRLEVRPNPSAWNAEFTLDGHLDSAVLEIYDSVGRLIERIHPVAHRVVWAPSESMGSGVYFARLEDAISSEVVQFVVLR
jgi:hypothetical protein